SLPTKAGAWSGSRDGRSRSSKDIDPVTGPADLAHVCFLTGCLFLQTEHGGLGDSVSRTAVLMAAGRLTSRDEAKPLQASRSGQTRRSAAEQFRQRHGSLERDR